MSDFIRIIMECEKCGVLFDGEADCSRSGTHEDKWYDILLNHEHKGIYIKRVDYANV